MKLSFLTRRTEQNRLASHLTATVSRLWIRALVALILGAVLGAVLLAQRARTAPQHPERRAVRTPSGASQPGSVQQ